MDRGSTDAADEPKQRVSIPYWQAAQRITGGVRACVRACARACVCVCVCVRVCVCTDATHQKEVSNVLNRGGQWHLLQARTSISSQSSTGFRYNTDESSKE